MNRPLHWNWQPPFGVYSLVIAQTSHRMTRILRRVLFFVAFTAYLLVQVMLVGMIPAYYWTQSHWLHSVPSGASLKRCAVDTSSTDESREGVATTPRRKMAHAPDTPAHRLHQADQGSETLGDLDSNRDRDNRVLVLARNVGCRVAPFHPGSGRLLGYRVSIPANWVVLIDEPDIGSSHAWSSVAAFHSKGVLAAGATAYWRREPPIANMSFYSAPLGDRRTSFLPNDKIISTRTLPLGKGTITCSEYIPGWLREHEDDDIQSIACATPQNDFYGWFDGDKASVTGFYRTLQNVRQTI